jgi:IS30 family transposase
MVYHHLTTAETIIIAMLRRKGMGSNAIAREIGRDKGTVSRELSRHSSSNPAIGYLHEAAQWHRRDRRHQANQKLKKIKEGSSLALFIFEKLRARWSPESIARTILGSEDLLTVALKTIYSFIKSSHPEFLRYFLLLSHRKRKRKDGKKHELILNRRWINERPKAIEARQKVGDWEGDTIVSGSRKQAIATFRERTSDFFMAGKMEDRGAQAMKQVTVKLFSPHAAEKRRTCTNDNGPEFALHQETERELGLTMYFAHPYHSWERGINENGNRELRRFFPKKTRFEDIDDWELDWAVNLINNRPMKRLGYRTPHQVFHET